MDSDSRPRTEDRDRQSAAQTPSDDIVEIDPAEFFDPEEFGIKRVALRNEDVKEHNTRAPSIKVEQQAEQFNRKE